MSESMTRPRPSKRGLETKTDLEYYNTRHLWTPPCETTPSRSESPDAEPGSFQGRIANMQDAVIISLLRRWRDAHRRWERVHGWKALILNSPSGTTAIIDAIMPNNRKIVWKRSLRPNWNWARQRRNTGVTPSALEKKLRLYTVYAVQPVVPLGAPRKFSYLYFNRLK